MGGKMHRKHIDVYCVVDSKWCYQTRQVTLIKYSAATFCAFGPENPERAMTYFASGEERMQDARNFLIGLLKLLYKL